MHTGKRGVGGAWVFLTHIMYIWTLRQKIRQTQAQTHIHTLTGRSFHTTVTHPLILLTLTDLRTHHAGINMQPQSHMQTHTHWSFWPCLTRTSSPGGFPTFKSSICAADDTEVRSLAMLASGDSWAFCWPTICNVLNVFIAFHIFYDVSQGSLLWERLTSDTINVNQSSGCWTDRQLTDQHHWGY